MPDDKAMTVLIPTPLRRYTNGQARVSVSGDNVATILERLDTEFPGLGERLRDDGGQIRRFVNVFVNGKNVRDLDGLETKVSPGDEIGIIPAMAGGLSAGSPQS